MRNAILPVVTMAGLQFSSMLAGAVLVETVFNWPGLGLLAYESILRRDNQTLLGILFYSALFVVVGNLLTDLAYRLIDPRIRTT
jgi:peptide/nickel transport system permease protein